MLSLFPQQAINRGARAPHIQVKAGKCNLNLQANGKYQVTADIRRGHIQLVTEQDALLHFKWLNALNGATEDDRIVMAGEAQFKRVKTGRGDSDRVYLLKFHGGGPKLMYWLQEKSSEKDEEVIKKMNELLANPQGAPSSSGANPATTNNTASTTAAPTPGNIDFTAFLNSFGLNAPATAPAASATATAASAPVPSNTTNNTSHSSSTTSNNNTNNNSQGALTLEDLRRALQRSQATNLNQPPATPQLQDILPAEEVLRTAILNDEQVQRDLIAQLPAEQQSPEHLEATLRSAQLQQALGSLSHALRNPDNLQSVLGNFQLDPSAANEQLARGDGIGAFLTALQAANPPETSEEEGKSNDNQAAGSGNSAEEEKQEDSKMDESG